MEEVPEDLLPAGETEPAGRIGLAATTRTPFFLCPNHNRLFENADRKFLDDAAFFGETLTRLPHDGWSNAIQVEYLLQGRPLPAKGARVWYFCRECSS